MTVHLHTAPPLHDALGNPIALSPLTHVTETGYVLPHRRDKVRSSQIVADSRTGLRETERLALMADLLAKGYHVETATGRVDATSSKALIVEWMVSVAWADDDVIGETVEPEILDFI